MIKDRIEYYRKKQVEVIDAQNAAKKALSEYKAEMKSEFGICDEERTDVLQLIEAWAKLQELNK